uniref:PPPDE domain-containing protein n=1 Tax=Chromera velia CCMP2878 TaxID=1169474 RepID=A0A0G4HMM3_9ALVE|eukprot:Cvel_7580.t1-p1 / transcript=Cvel_7580.t1 / gene=Cvel_7580 / organism=Chromera_velia_CCMP2878 / gene_product=hypothetical protein / transcript_product=hypothetical protein / location=Cvel_scaffold399:34948-38089(+) / protein_length=894 / sequence_SO=supercontig / SO=protein_coding / is_pseudo=false
MESGSRPCDPDTRLLLSTTPESNTIQVPVLTTTHRNPLSSMRESTQVREHPPSSRVDPQTRDLEMGEEAGQAEGDTQRERASLGWLPSPSVLQQSERTFFLSQVKKENRREVGGAVFSFSVAGGGMLWFIALLGPRLWLLALPFVCGMAFGRLFVWWLGRVMRAKNILQGERVDWNAALGDLKSIEKVREVAKKSLLWAVALVLPLLILTIVLCTWHSPFLSDSPGPFSVEDGGGLGRHLTRLIRILRQEETGNGGASQIVLSVRPEVVVLAPLCLLCIVGIVVLVTRLVFRTQYSRQPRLLNPSHASALPLKKSETIHVSCTFAAPPSMPPLPPPPPRRKPQKFFLSVPIPSAPPAPPTCDPFPSLTQSLHHQISEAPSSPLPVATARRRLSRPPVPARDFFPPPPQTPHIPLLQVKLEVFPLIPELVSLGSQFKDEGFVHVEVVVGESNIFFQRNGGIITCKSPPVAPPESDHEAAETKAKKKKKPTPKKKVIDLGWTQKTEKEVLQILDEMQMEGWDQYAYLFFERNCQHFAEAFVHRIRFSEPSNIRPFPPEIRALADTGTKVFGRQTVKRPEGAGTERCRRTNLPSYLFWRAEEERQQRFFDSRRQQREEEERREVFALEVRMFTKEYRLVHPNASQTAIAEAFEKKRQARQQQAGSTGEERGRERDQERNHVRNAVGVESSFPLSVSFPSPAPISVSLPPPTLAIGGDFDGVPSPSVLPSNLPQRHCQRHVIARQQLGSAPSSSAVNGRERRSSPSFLNRQVNPLTASAPQNPPVAASLPQPACRNSLQASSAASWAAGFEGRPDRVTRGTLNYAHATGGRGRDDSGEVDLEGGMRSAHPFTVGARGGWVGVGLSPSSSSGSSSSTWGLNAAAVLESVRRLFGFGRGK